MDEEEDDWEEEDWEDDDELKALGKKPPFKVMDTHQKIFLAENAEHYRKALLEAADKEENRCSCWKDGGSCISRRVRESICCTPCIKAKQLRISAGDDE